MKISSPEIFLLMDIVQAICVTLPTHSCKSVFAFLFQNILCRTYSKSIKSVERECLKEKCSVKQCLNICFLTEESIKKVDIMFCLWKFKALTDKDCYINIKGILF